MTKNLYTIKIRDTIYGYITDVFDTTDEDKAHEILEKTKKVIGKNERAFMSISFDTGIEEDYSWIYSDNLSVAFLDKVFG